MWRRTSPDRKFATSCLSHAQRTRSSRTNVRRVGASSYLTADQPVSHVQDSSTSPLQNLPLAVSRAWHQAAKQRLAKVVPGPRPGYSTESTPGPWMQPDGYAFDVDSLNTIKTLSPVSPKIGFRLLRAWKWSPGQQAADSELDGEHAEPQQGESRGAQWTTEVRPDGSPHEYPTMTVIHSTPRHLDVPQI